MTDEEREERNKLLREESDKLYEEQRRKMNRLLSESGKYYAIMHGEEDTRNYSPGQLAKRKAEAKEKYLDSILRILDSSFSSKMDRNNLAIRSIKNEISDSRKDNFITRKLKERQSNAEISNIRRTNELLSQAQKQVTAIMAVLEHTNDFSSFGSVMPDLKEVCRLLDDKDFNNVRESVKKVTSQEERQKEVEGKISKLNKGISKIYDDPSKVGLTGYLSFDSQLSLYGGGPEANLEECLKQLKLNSFGCFISPYATELSSSREEIDPSIYLKDSPYIEVINDFEELIKHGRVQISPDLQAIANDLPKIKESAITLAKLTYLNDQISSVNSQIASINPSQYGDVITTLREVQNRNAKEIDTLSAYLESVDFKAIEKGLIDNKEAIDQYKQGSKESAMQNYQDLSLLEVNTLRLIKECTDMNEKTKLIMELSEIKAKKESIASEYGFSEREVGMDTDLFVADHLKQEYETLPNRAEYGSFAQYVYMEYGINNDYIDSMSKNIDESNIDRKHYGMDSVRLDQELEQRYQSEAMLDERLSELKAQHGKASNPAPYYSYERGEVVNPEPFINDTSNQQYETMMEIDANREQMDQLRGEVDRRRNFPGMQENVYRDYVLYRAGLEDKSEAISFTEFVENQYNNEEVMDQSLEEATIESMQSGGMKR